MNRIDLSKFPTKRSHDVGDRCKKFLFIPRIYLMHEFEIKKGQKEIVDIDMPLTPLYVREGEQVVMKIIDGKLQIRVCVDDLS